MCCDFGAPRLVRCDNGTEFCYAVVEALFDAFGVTVAHGAVRHPKSQGGAERFNQTLLTLIRKLLDSSDDWQLELDLLLYYYRARPHSSTGLSPMQAMHGWSPHGLVVDRPSAVYNIGSWVAELDRRSAEIRQLLDEALAKTDFVAEPVPQYLAGEKVLLRQPNRSQKRRAPFDSGWVVVKHVGPSTVLTRHQTRDAEKIVNVELVKPDTALPVADADSPEEVGPEVGDDRHGFALEFCEADAVPPVDGGRDGPRLRDRSSLRRPPRYGS